MRKWCVIVFLPLFFSAPLPSKTAAGEDSVSVKDALCVLSLGGNVFLSGAKDTVWKSVDRGLNWQRYGRTRGIKGEVRALSGSGAGIFAASSSGVYRSSDGGREWRRVFRGKGLFSVLCSGSRVLAAGESGLVISDDNGGHWVKAGGALSSMPVYRLCRGARGGIYLAASDGVYESPDNGNTWDNIMSCGVVPEGEEEPGGEDEEPAQEARANGNALIAALPHGGVCVSCRGRVYLAQSSGSQFEELSAQGLSRYPLTAVTAGYAGEIYATDGREVFVYYPSVGYWSEAEVPSGIRRVNDITAAVPGRLLLLCDSGIVESGVSGPPAHPVDSRPPAEKEGEPDIREVVDASIALTDSGQEKIFRWRKLAAARGWLPKVSVSADRNGTDRWHWEGGSTTKQEDDCLRKGRYTQEWSVALVWELGDLIWNDAQTSIDVRSKLTAELRQEIIEQVTKAYFERLRVRHELENMRLEDRKRRFDKEIRLRELTAYLDAMSGGLYSIRRQ
jgi:photosystem II stability/assembly factor-like uncharacterized protein